MQENDALSLLGFGAPKDPPKKDPKNDLPKPNIGIGFNSSFKKPGLTLSPLPHKFNFTKELVWVGTANSVNGGMGVFASATEYLSGKITLGTNGKFYRSNWGGNQYVSTIKLSKVGGMIGYGTLGLGTAFDVYGVFQYYSEGANSPNAVHPGKAGLNLGVGVWALANPSTAIGAAMYYSVDTFYPGGFKVAMENNAILIRENQEILGPRWNLYRDH